MKENLLRGQNEQKQKSSWTEISEIEVEAREAGEMFRG